MLVHLNEFPAVVLYFTFFFHVSNKKFEKINFFCLYFDKTNFVYFLLKKVQVQYKVQYSAVQSTKKVRDTAVPVQLSTKYKKSTVLQYSVLVLPTALQFQIKIKYNVVSFKKIIW